MSKVDFENKFKLILTDKYLDKRLTKLEKSAKLKWDAIKKGQSEVKELSCCVVNSFGVMLKTLKISRRDLNHFIQSPNSQSKPECIWGRNLSAPHHAEVPNSKENEIPKISSVSSFSTYLVSNFSEVIGSHSTQSKCNSQTDLFKSSHYVLHSAIGTKRKEYRLSSSVSTFELKYNEFSDLGYKSNQSHTHHFDQAALENCSYKYHKNFLKKEILNYNGALKRLGIRNIKIQTEDKGHEVDDSKEKKLIEEEENRRLAIEKIKKESAYLYQLALEEEGAFFISK